MPKRDILLAMFDIRPKGDSAGFGLLSSAETLDLRTDQKIEGEKHYVKPAVSETVLTSSKTKSPPLAFDQNKAVFVKELESLLAVNFDPEAEFNKFGICLNNSTRSGKARKLIRRVCSSQAEQEPEKIPPKNIVSGCNIVPVPRQFFAEPRAELIWQKTSYNRGPKGNFSGSPASRDLETWLENMRRKAPSRIFRPEKDRRLKGHWLRVWPKWSSWFRRRNSYLGLFLAAAFLVVVGVAKGGILISDSVIKNGNNGLANLERAKEDLSNLDFYTATADFNLARDDFAMTSSTLSRLGAAIINVFSSLPGLDKLKSADNLLEAGQNISEAGKDVASALSFLYDEGALSFFKKGDSGDNTKASSLFAGFGAAISSALQKVTEAELLLADINIYALPEEKQQALADFKNQLPDLKDYLTNGLKYTEFLAGFLGDSRARTYLLLLQNNSELRATGGFPGTYAVLSLKDGQLEKIFVEDIYRSDARSGENIIPPKPLQHITPNWGMRDANWFADFPTSAKKISEFYEFNSGVKVDGVLTFTPEVIARILKIIGPLDMPEYDAKLSADNFLTIIQNEVEYEADKSNPKQIVVDLQPKFFEKLGNQDKNNWAIILGELPNLVAGKHILAYFNDKSLEQMAVDFGLGGEIRSVLGDYLQVVFNNVKGSKTDFVTENSFRLEVVPQDDVFTHSLSIIRKHNGGNMAHGFYNRENPAYVKIYVPGGSVLKTIAGHALADFKPLVDYSELNFKTDRDLAKIEGPVFNPMPGVDVFKESGRTVFGFWLITKPGQESKAKLEYETPVAQINNGYNLYWQKQSGEKGAEFDFVFTVPEDQAPRGISEELVLIGDKLILNSDLTVDREIRIGTD